MKKILFEIVSGKISIPDLRQSAEIFAYGYDEKLKAGFIGFNSGKIVRTDKEKMDLLLSLASVTNQGPLIEIGAIPPDSSILEILEIIMALRLYKTERKEQANRIRQILAEIV
jgi:hypothetical protein